MTQQLLATHVTRSACDGTAGIGTRAAHIDIVQTPKTIEVRRRIIRIGSIKKCLATHQHRVIEIATRKMEKLLQVSWRQQTRPYTVLSILDVLQYFFPGLIFHVR